MSAPDGASGAPSNDTLAKLLVQMTQLGQQFTTIINRLDTLENHYKTDKELLTKELNETLKESVNVKFKSLKDHLDSLLFPDNPTPTHSDMDYESDSSFKSTNTAASKKRAGSPPFMMVDRKAKKLRNKAEPPKTVDPKTKSPSTPNQPIPSLHDHNKPASSHAVQHSIKPKTANKLNEPHSPQQPIRQPQISNNNSRSQQNPPLAQNIPKIPAIFLKDPAHWTDVSRQMSIKKIPFSQAKYVRDSVRIQPTDSTAYRDLVNLLTKLKLEHHTFPLEEEKFVRAVIRDIPIVVGLQVIKDDLITQGFEVTAVTRMRSFYSKQDLPLVHVVLKPGQSRIFSINHVAGLHVRIQVPHKHNGVSQCHKCQGFGHSQSHCNITPKCVKCALSHKPGECKKQTTDKPKCANCGDAHPASYRGCPKFPKPKKAKKPTQDTPPIPDQPLPQPNDFPLPRKSQPPVPQPQSTANYARALNPKQKQTQDQQKHELFFNLFPTLVDNPQALDILQKFHKLALA